MKFLERFKRSQDLPAVRAFQNAKANLVKDKELAYEVLSENLKGKKLCPLMLGAPCMGDACMLFQEYIKKNNETGSEEKFKACSLSQSNPIMMETNFKIQALTNALIGVAKETAEDLKRNDNRDTDTNVSPK